MYPKHKENNHKCTLKEKEEKNSFVIYFNLHSIFSFIVVEKGSKGKMLFLKKNLNEMSYVQKIKSKILQILTPMNM